MREPAIGGTREPAIGARDAIGGARERSSSSRSAWRFAAVAIALVALGGAAAYHVASAFFSRRVASEVANHRVVVGIARAERALVIVIDGLRKDNALDNGRLPLAQELAAAGASGPSYARDPTMTGAGVRALATGTPPAFSDITENDRIARVEHQHLLSALVEAGHVVAAVGDHTWTDGFGDAIAVPRTHSGLPPVLELMDPVERQDLAFLAQARRVLRDRLASVTIVHLFGADAVSHGRGPHSATYARKLARLDGQLRELVAACGDDCLVVLTSDHGASDRGHHGMGEAIARQTPLVLRGPGVRAGVRFVAQQADVAPTLATLLGAPIPAAARGRVLVEALDLPAATRDRTLAELAVANAERLADYARAHDAAFGTDLPIADLAAIRARLAAGDVHAAREGADRASAAILDELHADDVWRTRWLLPWLVGLGLAAAALVAWFAVPGPRVRWRSIAIAAVAMVAAIAAFVAWRARDATLHRELAASDTLWAIPREAYAAFVIVIAALATWVVARTRIGATSRIIATMTLVGCAAASDQLLLWATFGVLGALVGVRALWLVAVVVPWTFAPAIGVYAAAGVLGCLLVRASVVDRRWRLVISIAVASGMLVRILGTPALAMRGYLIALAIAMIVALCSRAASRRLVVGWLAAAALLAMSTAAQVLPLAGVLAVVALGGALSPQRFAAIVAAGRLAIFAILERAFSYSRVEWHAGALGNPEGNPQLEHALVAVKLALPMIALVGIAGARLAGRFATGLAWLTAYVLVHMAFSIGSLVLTAGQYHTPFVDLSELLFFAAFLGSVAVAWVIEALVGDDRP